MNLSLYVASFTFLWAIFLIGFSQQSLLNLYERSVSRSLEGCALRTPKDTLKPSLIRIVTFLVISRSFGTSAEQHLVMVDCVCEIWFEGNAIATAVDRNCKR